MSTLPTPGITGKSRGWLTFLGIFSILVGIFAIAFPLAASVAISQVIGIILVVSGVFSLGAVLFGEEKNHRIATVVLALIRLAVGMMLLLFIKSGVIALTALLGFFFLAEGATFIFSAMALRHNRAWPLMLINGLVALLLGWMIFSNIPSSAAWATGLLYGINSIFYGVALLGFSAMHGKSA
ncbi:MAG: HdeD family acid-resistance protein [Chthoniobacterales bacterium]